MSSWMERPAKTPTLISDVNKDWTCKDKDKDQAYKDQNKDKDKDKDLTNKDQDKDKDLNLVLKESLRTRKRQWLHLQLLTASCS